MKKENKSQYRYTEDENDDHNIDDLVQIDSMFTSDFKDNILYILYGWIHSK